MGIYYYYYYYYERIWLKCHKIQGTARTLYNKQDVFGVKHKTKTKIVRRSPDQSIGGKVLFWGAVGKLSVMSTRWHWTAGCSIHAKPRPEMHSRQRWDGTSTVRRASTLTLTSAAVTSLCPPLCGILQQNMAEPSSADNGTWAWTQSAAAPAASVGRGAADWRPHAFWLRKPAKQQRSARTEVGWVDCLAVRQALHCRSQAEAWQVQRPATAEPAVSVIGECYWSR